MSERRAAIYRTARRLAVLTVFIIAINLGISWVLEQLKAADSPMLGGVYLWVIIVSLVVYALLMAIPFVPGVEIGLSLLMIQGPPVAPFVFLATFSGLSLSYLLGRYLPYSYLHRVFADLGMKRACRLLDRLKPLNQQCRLDMLRNRLPRWLGPVAVNYRYVTVALALNMPGNIILGGGGGIALIAGLSRVFSPAATLLTFAVAVSPVAAAVYFFDADIFGTWGPAR